VTKSKPRTRVGFKLKKKLTNELYHPLVKKNGESFGDVIVTEVEENAVKTEERPLTSSTYNPVEEARKIIKETPPEDVESVLVSDEFTKLFTKKPKRVIVGSESFTSTPTYTFDE
jgi:transposase